MVKSMRPSTRDNSLAGEVGRLVGPRPTAQEPAAGGVEPPISCDFLPGASARRCAELGEFDLDAQADLGQPPFRSLSPALSASSGGRGLESRKRGGVSGQRLELELAECI
jgi:hypothetical protein